MEEFSKPRAAQVNTKSSDVDLVTESDVRVEQLLIDGLRAQFPEHRCVMAVTPLTTHVS